jgi:hypothetical protein
MLWCAAVIDLVVKRSPTYVALLFLSVRVMVPCCKQVQAAYGCLALHVAAIVYIYITMPKVQVTTATVTPATVLLSPHIYVCRTSAIALALCYQYAALTACINYAHRHSLTLRYRAGRVLIALVCYIYSPYALLFPSQQPTSDLPQADVAPDISVLQKLLKAWWCRAVLALTVLLLLTAFCYLYDVRSAVAVAATALNEAAAVVMRCCLGCMRSTWEWLCLHVTYTHMLLLAAAALMCASLAVIVKQKVCIALPLTTT